MCRRECVCVCLCVCVCVHVCVSVSACERVPFIPLCGNKPVPGN